MVNPHAEDVCGSGAVQDFTDVSQDGLLFGPPIESKAAPDEPDVVAPASASHCARWAPLLGPNFFLAHPAGTALILEAEKAQQR